MCSNCGHPSKEVTCGTGVQYSLSRPNGYDQVFYLAEHIEPDASIKLRGGEKITCFAGDARVALMAHAGQPAVRITLLKTGKQRYNPIMTS